MTVKSVRPRLSRDDVGARPASAAVVPRRLLQYDQRHRLSDSATAISNIGIGRIQAPETRRRTMRLFDRWQGPSDRRSSTLCDRWVYYRSEKRHRSVCGVVPGLPKPEHPVSSRGDTDRPPDQFLRRQLVRRTCRWPRFRLSSMASPMFSTWTMTQVDAQFRQRPGAVQIAIAGLNITSQDISVLMTSGPFGPDALALGPDLTARSSMPTVSRWTSSLG